MTLDGTNTWVLREPGASRSVVIDPGPIEDGHLDALDEQTGDVALVLLTHHHFDHSEVAVEFADAQGLPGARPRPGVLLRRRPARPTASVIDVDGLQLRVVTTPGHTADSISLVLPAERRAAVRRHGAGPRYDGRRLPRRPARPLLRLASSGCARSPPPARSRTIWPAHGPVLDDALGALDYYLVHRRQRLAQVEARARAAGRRRTGRRRRGAAPPGRRDRLPGRRRVALGRRRAGRSAPSSPT